MKGLTRGARGRGSTKGQIDSWLQIKGFGTVIGWCEGGGSIGYPLPGRSDQGTIIQIICVAGMGAGVCKTFASSFHGPPWISRELVLPDDDA